MATSNDNNFNFNWRTWKDVIIIFGVTYLIFLLIGCTSTKSVESTETTEYTDKAHIERVNTWYDVSKIDTIIRDRFITLVLNEKGDTVKEKELVYVREKAESNSNLNNRVEKVDSATTKSTRNHNKEVEKKAELLWWQKFQLATYPYIIGIMFFLFIGLFLRFKGKGLLGKVGNKV